MAQAFKEKWPELKEFSDKQLMTKIIKDEFTKRNDKNFFDCCYYNETDIKEIFFT